MSLSTLLGRGQEEIFLQILHMSTQELSDNLRENGLSEEGDKATINLENFLRSRQKIVRPLAILTHPEKDTPAGNPENTPESSEGETVMFNEEEAREILEFHNLLQM